MRAATPSLPAASPGDGPEKDHTPAARTIDSTQTLRVLTPLELEAGDASKWFAIELIRSADPIDADEVPNLDIFDEYRLYCVREAGDAANQHVLRVGFFSSEVAAQAVAGYLAAYFPTPKLSRVSVAERERFAEKLVTARKDVGASGRRTDIEVISPCPLPQAQVQAEAAGAREHPTPRTSSFWSRLRGSR